MPGIVRHPLLEVGVTGENEEQVAQPVEVFDGVDGDSGVGRGAELDDAPLGSAADGAGDVDRRRQRRAGGKNEGREGEEGLLVPVDRLLEGLDVGKGNPLQGIPRRGELGTEFEQITLDPSQQVVDRSAPRNGADEAEVAVELVDGSEGLDPEVVLPHPRATEQAGFTGVAGLRVDLHSQPPWERGSIAGRILLPMRKTFNRSIVDRRLPGHSALSVALACLVAFPTGTSPEGGKASVAWAAEEPRPEGATASPSALEVGYLSPPVKVTDGLSKAGEGYFAPDGRRICYQGVPQGYPFYQIYVQPFDAAAPRPTSATRVSPGRGRTTCSWFSPDGTRLLFASSHPDPAIDKTEADAKAQAEEDARTGRRRRYQWDFDPHMDLFTSRLDGSDLRQITDTPGYDAECSWSPDGTRLLFVSDRDGDADIYVADADGGNVRQVTDEPGYDGGPFFSPDGAWICYRTDRLEKDMLQIHVMRADGSADTAVTAGKGVHWAPYWHPTKPWLIWTGADHSDPTQRPNYDLWVGRYEGDPEKGTFRVGEPLRLTDHPGADVLPVFSPDGTLLMWTASRDGERSASQLWVSSPDLDAIERDLPAVAPVETAR